MRTATVLGVLLAVDAACIGVYFWQMPHGWDMLPERWFSLGWDRSLAEIYQYAKLVVVAGLLVAIGRRWRSPAALGAAAVVGLLLIDDVVTLHEHLGRGLAGEFGGVARALRPEDYGELISMACLLGVSLIIMGLTHARSDLRGRRLMWPFYGFMAAYGFFAGAVDLLHENTASPFMLRVALGALEDGGEMVVISGLTFFMLRQWRRAAAGPGEFAAGSSGTEPYVAADLS